MKGGKKPITAQKDGEELEPKIISGDVPNDQVLHPQIGTEVKSDVGSSRPKRATNKYVTGDYKILNGEGKREGVKIDEKSNGLKKKDKFTISLSQSEIDEDFMTMTGKHPSHKLIKQSKNVQKDLNNLFPSLRLKKKDKFSISLSQSEIDEDFMTMTGKHPPRKLIKRSKNVQNDLDNLFPGLRLSKITPNTYKVSTSR